MCGIGGLVSLAAGEAPPTEEQMHLLISRLHHRGPDAQSVWRGDGIVLAHTRLSIIDVESSHQPMVGDLGHVMVYNGAIFNYKELRRQLPGPWKTSGDSEVMLRLLARHGIKGLQRIRGQFAVALWNQTSRKLVLARDAMGVLPLFWWTDGRQLAFASEVDALRAILRMPLDIDPDSLALYLTHRAVPAPGSLWRGIQKLPPGHALEISPGSGPRLTDWRPAPTEVNTAMTEGQAIEGSSRRLRAAVERALVADVPVGAYLSGGLDSSLVCAMVRQVRPATPLHTYCASFEDESADESGWAQRVADHIGSHHTTVPVRSEDFLDEWPRLSRFRGAPVSEPSDVALYRLAERARQDVKVVLSGEGADETFAGYPKHRYASLSARAGRVPVRVRRDVLLTAAAALPVKGRRLSVALRALAEEGEANRLRAWFASFSPDEIEQLTGRPPTPASADLRGTPLARMLRYDQGIWLSDNLLERGDRMTMAASLELRPPYLDADLVDFASTIHHRILMKQGAGKYVLRKLAEPLLPAPIVGRKKQGFPVPLSAWLRGRMGEDAFDLLLSTDSFISTYVDQHHVRTILTDHRSGKGDRTGKIWTLLSLEVWGRQVARRALMTDVP